VDTIVEFTATGSSLTGLYDANNSGLLISDASLGTGNYSVASNGRGTASFPWLQTGANSMIGAMSYNFYVVDSSPVIFLETDSDQVSLETFALQDPGAATATQARSMQVRPALIAPGAVRMHRAASR
jgi:hypothetical protein